MNAAEVSRVLAANGNKVTPEQRARIEHLIANTSQAELAGVISTIRQGHNLPQAEEWLEGARRASESVGPEAFELALAMFGESAVLEWSQCLQVAPAMTYRASKIAVDAARDAESAELDAAADSAVMSSPLGAVLKPGTQPAASQRRPDVQNAPAVTTITLNDQTAGRATPPNQGTPAAQAGQLGQLGQLAQPGQPVPSGQPVDLTGPNQVTRG